ncbi:MAG: flagellar protein FliT [Candidatus Nitrotoga sp.]
MHSNIEDYEYLSLLTSQMRIAAAQGKWEQLSKLEGLCGERIAAMQQRAANTPIGESTRNHKAALIRKILSDDAEIRNYTMPWIARLQLSIKGK